MNTNIDTHCEGAARLWHAIKGQTYIFILDFVALLFNSSFKHPNLSKQENPLLKSLLMVEFGKGSANWNATIIPGISFIFAFLALMS